MKFSTLKYLVIVFVFTSCTVLRPDSNNVGLPDYNKRVEVAGAHYDKVLTPVGYTGIIASTVAGGYYGYKSEMTQHYSGTERKTGAVGNVLIGAAAGFTVSYLLNKAFGWGMQYPVSDPNKWVEKANKNFINLGKGNSDFELVHRSAHDNWTVKQFKDVEDFTKAFPGSSRTNDVLWAGGQTLERKYLPGIIDLNPINPYNAGIKKRYLNLSNTTLECIDAKNRYPELNDSSEYKAIAKIQSVSDAIAVENNWPNTKYRKFFVEKYYNAAETTSEYIVIDKKYSEYIVRDRLISDASKSVLSFNDLLLYRSYFGSQTQHDDKIFESIYEKLIDNDLARLIDMYPNAKSVDGAIKKRINNAVTMPAVKVLLEKYGDKYYDYAAYRAEQIMNYDHLQFSSFISLFPRAPRLHQYDDYGTICYYLGDWNTPDSCAQGYGIRLSKYSDYDFYRIGKFENGKLHGANCKIFYGKEFTYAGECKDDDASGHGTGYGDKIYRRFPYKAKDVNYTGMWAYGRPSGRGKIEGSDNGEPVWIDGEFLAGYAHGWAELRHSSGVRVSGNWNTGQPDGVMTIKKWTLLGLISSEAKVEVYNFKDLEVEMKKVYGNFVGQLSGGGKTSSASSSNSSPRCYKVTFHEQTKNVFNQIDDAYYSVVCLQGENRGSDYPIYIDNNGGSKPYYLRALPFNNTFKTYEDALDYVLKKQCGCK